MRPTDILAEYRGFLVDVDGVLVRGQQPIPGAQEAFRDLRDRAKTVALTNSSSRSCEVLADHLTSLGFPVEPENIVTTSRIAAEYLARLAGFVTFWVLGEDGLRIELERAGHRPAASPEEADWVVAGIDRAISYETLAAALRALRSGARLLGTNSDPTFPGADGLLPGAGSILGALEGMGFTPEETVGKPSPIAFETALHRFDAEPASTLMIGDRLETDIVGATEAGLPSALVLTGVTSPETAASSKIRPTWIATSLAALVRGEATRTAS